MEFMTWDEGHVASVVAESEAVAVRFRSGEVCCLPTYAARELAEKLLVVLDQVTDDPPESLPADMDCVL